MVSPARLAANRANARRSTGPRTPAGKQTAALNALRHGLYARVALVPALGEGEEEWAAHRASVCRALGPIGAAEQVVAERVAWLLWRQRRVATYAPTADPTALPPDPDAITGDEADRTVPLRPGAPPAFRLAHTRNRLRCLRGGLAADRAGAAVLAGRDDGGLVAAAALGVTNAAGLLLGWGPLGRPDPWAAVLAGLGVEVEHRCQAPWTADLLRRAVAAAGAGAGRDGATFLAEAQAAAAAEVDRWVAAVARAEAEEAGLAAEMRAARARASAGALFAEDPRAERADRVEAHLSRELDRALGQLARLRAFRLLPEPRPGEADEPAGFVLRLPRTAT